MTTEADLRARILKAVRQMWTRRMGVLLYGRPASATTGPGHPDLFGIARGRFVALEIKKARAKPTDLQMQRLRELRECGAYAWIVRTEEQACYAIYWTVKGWTRPLSNEPLDLGDWLLGEAAKPAPAEEFAPNAVEPMPFEPAFGRPRDTEDDFQIPVPPQEEAEMIELDGVVPIESIQAQADREQAAYLDANEPEVPLVTIVPSDALERLDKDIRTVGDRVTLIFERLDTYTAVLSSVHGMLSKLMQLVTEDDENGQVVAVDVPEQSAPAAPAKRTRRKKAEAPAQEPEPAPAILEDLPF